MRIPLRDNSVQCVVTSPPYWGLRDYGIDNQFGLEATLDEYIEKMVAMFREVWRVLRDDGTCWLNLGDSYANDRRNKRLTDLKPKDLVGIPWRVAFALQAAGWYLRSDIIWSKPNPMPESVTDRPTKTHEYIFLLSKKKRYYFDHEAVKEPATESNLLRWRQKEGINSRMHQDRDPSHSNERKPRSARNIGRSKKPDGWATHAGRHGSFHKNGREKGEAAMIDLSAGRNIRTVWTIATQPYSEAHFATFPEALIKPCILAGCPVGGVVFDPFVGSGTTVKVAQDLGRIGVEMDLNEAYLTLPRRRTAQQGFGALLRE